jgi:hypothetical protein
VAKLPLTVTNVTPRPGKLWAVTVAYHDGTVGQFIVPQTLATMEAVTISALAIGVLMSIAEGELTFHGPANRRFTPRP